MSKIKEKPKLWHKIIKITMFSDILFVLQKDRNIKEFEKVICSYKITEDDKIHCIKAYEANCDANGFASKLGTGRFFMVVFMDAPKGTLSHEAVHISRMLFEHRGIPVSQDTEELECMLVGEIINQTSI